MLKRNTIAWQRVLSIPMPRAIEVAYRNQRGVRLIDQERSRVALTSRSNTLQLASSSDANRTIGNCRMRAPLQPKSLVASTEDRITEIIGRVIATMKTRERCARVNGILPRQPGTR